MHSAFQIERIKPKKTINLQNLIEKKNNKEEPKK